MPTIYAVSDIHDCLKPFEEALELIDLKDKENQLVLCGDYMDYGTQNCVILKANSFGE
ncbi:MAG TPA: metallophosphoesterase [Clostridia bacterium]|nr:metallophosphoesterase [Clostridia bacterium]